MRPWIAPGAVVRSSSAFDTAVLEKRDERGPG
jgi:hypothetical protein